MSRNDPPYTTRPLSPNSLERAVQFNEEAFQEIAEALGEESEYDAESDAEYKEIMSLVLGAKLGCDLKNRNIVIINESDFDQEALEKLQIYIKRAQDLFFKEVVIEGGDPCKFEFYPSKTPSSIKTGIDSYFCFSPYRMARKESELADIIYVDDLVCNIFVNATLKNILDNLNKKNGTNFSFIELPAKESVVSEGDQFSFARDAAIVVDGKLVKHDSTKISREFVRKAKVFEADLAAYCGIEDFNNHPDIKIAPSLIEGGNVVDLQAKRVLFMNRYPISFLEDVFTKQATFRKSFLKDFIAQDPELKDLPEEEGLNFAMIKILELHKKNPIAIRKKSMDFEKGIIDKKNAEVKKWFKENLDYDVEFIDLDLENIIKTSSVNELYHLDCFFNVAGRKLAILPELGILTPACEDMIRDIFGEENIIRLTQEERINGGTNFVIFDDTIILTRPGRHSRSLAEKLSQKGFNVVIPPFSLSANPEIDPQKEAQQNPRMFATIKECQESANWNAEGLRCRLGQVPDILLRAISTYKPSANPSNSGASAAQEGAFAKVSKSASVAQN